MIVAGMGYRSGADVAQLLATLERAGRMPDALASIAARACGPLAELAERLGRPLIALAPDRIAGIATPTRSARIEAGYATGSLAEACALAAAGPGARLIVARLTGPCGTATVALAEGPRT